MLAFNIKLELVPPLPYILPFVELKFVVVAVIVSELLDCVKLPAVTRVKLVPADDAPPIVVTPELESLIFTTPLAFAVIFATFVVNDVLVELPSIFPFVDVSVRAPALIVPVIFAFCKSLYDVRFTVPTGVTLFPIAPPKLNDPADAVNVTTEFTFVLPTSIVPLEFVANVLAFGATKLNVFAAPDAPFTVTVPLAVSDKYALCPDAFAFATKLLADITKLLVVPPLPYILPFVDVRFAVPAVIVSEPLPCVKLPAASNENVPAAPDAPLIVVPPLAVSDK